MDSQDLKLFFMFDKAIEGVEKIQELIKVASKDGLDQDVVAGKLQRIDDKMEELKKQLLKDNKANDKILKRKENQINKAQERQRLLEEKQELQQIKNRRKDKNRKLKEDFQAAGHDTYSVPHISTEVLEIEIRKRREAEQQLRESERELALLKQKLIEKERENEILREEIETQKTIIEIYERAAEDVSEQDATWQMEEESNHSEMSMVESRSQMMMDMSEGQPNLGMEEEELLKVSEDLQTDDQEQQAQPKLLSKISETESINVPEAQKIRSMQSSKEEIQKVEEAAGSKKEEVDNIESNKEVKNPQSETVRANVERKQEEKKNQGWFSWQNWFRKSKK